MTKFIKFLFEKCTFLNYSYFFTENQSYEAIEERRIYDQNSTPCTSYGYNSNVVYTHHHGLTRHSHSSIESSVEYEQPSHDQHVTNEQEVTQDLEVTEKHSENGESEEKKASNGNDTSNGIDIPEESGTKGMKVEAAARKIWREADEKEADHVKQLVKDLGAEHFAVVEKNGRKLYILKQRGGSSYLFLGKNLQSKE